MSTPGTLYSLQDPITGIVYTGWRPALRTSTVQLSIDPILQAQLQYLEYRNTNKSAHIRRRPAKADPCPILNSGKYVCALFTLVSSFYIFRTQAALTAPPPPGSFT